MISITLYNTPSQLPTECGEDDEAQEPAQLHAHGVAGGGEAEVGGPQHGERPAVHRHVLGGRQQTQEEEHDGEGGDGEATSTLALAQPGVQVEVGDNHGDA